MVDFFIEKFTAIAQKYRGEYYFTEEIVGGIGGSDLPLSKHYINVPNQNRTISFCIEFGGTAFATITTKVENGNPYKKFQFKKTSPYILLFRKNKRSLIARSNIDSFKHWVDNEIVKSGMEKISFDTLFEPQIFFEKVGTELNVKMMFSMAFENKENVIEPIIQFLRSLTVYLKS